MFATTIEHLKALGGEPVEIDFEPFLEAARLLYEGPWVAERYSVAGALIEQQPDAVLPVIKAVLEKAPGTTAVQLFQAQYRLQQLKAVCDRTMAEVDCVLTPAYPRPVTLAELHAEPVKRNSDLGYYTNFMNMLDYAAVAVPAATMHNGLPWGVTLFGRVFTDQYLLSLADALQRRTGLALVGSNVITTPVPQNPARNDRTRVVVCGAHLDGLPLNWQLRQRGGRLLEATTSSPAYKLYALAGGPVLRPGMVRVAEGGVAIAVEVWDIPSSELGSFLTGIPAPLGLGKVELEDGRWETGFICDAYGLDGAEDITRFGGWKAWLASRD